METTIPASPQRPQVEMMACLEMEMELDHSDHYSDHDDTTPLTTTSSANNPTPITIPAPCVNLAQGLVEYIKLWVQLYPRTSLGLGCSLTVLFLVQWSPLSHSRHPKPMIRNHLEKDYASITTDYNFQKANIHHWCLFGGNDNCQCEDPTFGQSREELKGWSETHRRNKDQIQRTPQVDRGEELDVVFVGDQTFQMWGEGRLLDHEFTEGNQIAAYFNQTFRSADGIHGLSLGIYTDRTTNLLWRLKHGEMPTNLKAKVWWLLIGANDLALAMCSEDVVTLGILRAAEEIAFQNPNAKIVIQGLLPRSNHKDGSLHMTDEKRGSTFRQSNALDRNKQPIVEKPFKDNNIWSFRTDQMNPDQLDPGHSTISEALKQAQEQAKQPYFDYYIWPSILAINQELKGFCEKHASQQFVYFDADDLFVETIKRGGVNDEKQIKKDLMPNAVLLGYKGHQVLIDAVKKKLQDLLER
ncbi:Platelet-activating factor acetylhydrolase IB subunit beta [Seminavis robusta]|uniref:Platelet-activating factor acetylhydrolase IB subunit beta n=1 Tax=Seminavis robusta TaxID=568900 RepID=A0A9N8H6J9_9STRA|nr:Platelet-activating factor acetylhydrolase IB subunit beta [Seminavis robusta]|eukprot:Sro174_g076480.1 Platelet-activating factor acetylhydrolase IB subunit beta (469) ;mRNA; f:3316-4847